ncbi:MAG: bifunctional ornithine acetyltransferase/N-acetylglutamate synthase, partial [Dehalococcoidales bacterium]|nr:bifunctional ornithine acetyltransferase/N-acetylglutamate synthase [Dehalococcoidales bacterium]
FDDIMVVEAGKAVAFDREKAAAVLNRSEVPIRLALNLGAMTATAWGCDLSEEYVTINSEYTT